MRYGKLSERPEFFRLTEDEHPLKRGLVCAGLGLTHKTTRYHDSSQRGNHGTLTNMDPATDWVWDSTLNRWVLAYSSGDSQYVNIGNRASFGSGDFSVCSWALGQQSAIAHIAAKGQYNVGWALYDLHGTASHYLTFRGDNGLYAFTNIDVLADGAWHHVAGVVSGLVGTLYVDGVAVMADDTTGVGYARSYNTYFGSRSLSAGEYWNGGLCDQMLYERALSTAEIQQLADPSNVMLSGLILPPRRRLWAVSGGAPPASIIPRIMHHRRLQGAA